MRRVLFVVLLAVALVATACASATPTVVPTKTAPPTAVPTKAAPTTVPAPANVKITVAGSTTVQPLAEKLAEVYSAKYPNVQIDVQGGGTGVGVKSGGEGTVDIGAASRDLKDDEKKQYPDLRQIMIAWDAIAIVVNPSVTVSGLSKDQIRDIYMGKITNWKQVGGADKAITLVSREEGSGTRDGFQSLVMGNDANGKANPIAASAILQASNGAVRTTVATTPDAIGYIGFGYVDKSVKALVFDGVELTAATAASKQYPLVRPLNMLVKGTPKPEVQAWLDWILSADGQQVAVTEGYVAVK